METKSDEINFEAVHSYFKVTRCNWFNGTKVLNVKRSKLKERGGEALLLGIVVQ